MRTGHTIAGPAVIDEYTTTVLVGVGDRLHVDAAGNFVIDLRAAADSAAAPTISRSHRMSATTISHQAREAAAAAGTAAALDPIPLALVQARLDHIARQMGWVMIRTSRSPIFNQSHDFSCFITDAAGTLVSQADGIPIHTGGGGLRGARAAAGVRRQDRAKTMRSC